VINLEVPIEIMSQNVLERQHWTARNKFRTNSAVMLRLAMDPKHHAGGPRTVELVTYRKRLITDHANLVGGSKPFVDAMVRVGLLVDDNDKMARITYKQRLASEHPNKRVCTQVFITEGIAP
jgi:hypothetical protein